MNGPQADLVSVIMPCYNARPFLEEAVQSVMNQSDPRVELILVDDGSDDGSRDLAAELAARWPGRIRVLHQERRGPYVARNLGLAEARGGLIAFLDADDWWSPDFVAKMRAALDRHSEAGLAYCGWQNVGLPGGRGAPHVPPDYEAEGKLDRFLRAASPWPIHAALVRRAVIEAAGGFGTWLPTCMDYDLWLRIGLAHPIVRVPEVLAFYRHHDRGQIVSTQWRQARNVWLVKKRFVREHPERVAGLDARRLRDHIDGALLRRGYDNYWRRDLVSAQRIFRQVLRTRAWGLKDLRYLLPALLPQRLYQRLIRLAD